MPDREAITGKLQKELDDLIAFHGVLITNAYHQRQHVDWVRRGLAGT